MYAIRSYYALSALKAELQPSIALWSDVILNAVFDQTELDRLRGQWVANISQ